MTSSTSILSDLPCAKCGYNLRTLPHSSRCPECGTPVEKSLAFQRNLAPLARGIGSLAIASWIMFGIACLRLFDGVYEQLIPLIFHGSPLVLRPYYTASYVVGLFDSALFLVALLFFVRTGFAPRFLQWPKPNAWILTLLIAADVLLSFALSLADLTDTIRAIPFTFDTLLFRFNILAALSVIGIVETAYFYLFLAGICQRAEFSRLARFTFFLFIAKTILNIAYLLMTINTLFALVAGDLATPLESTLRDILDWSYIPYRMASVVYWLVLAMTASPLARQAKSSHVGFAI